MILENDFADYRFCLYRDPSFGYVATLLLINDLAVLDWAALVLPMIGWLRRYDIRANLLVRPPLWKAILEHTLIFPNYCG